MCDVAYVATIAIVLCIWAGDSEYLCYINSYIAVAIVIILINPTSAKLQFIIGLINVCQRVRWD